MSRAVSELYRRLARRRPGAARLTVGSRTHEDFAMARVVGGWQLLLLCAIGACAEAAVGTRPFHVDPDRTSARFSVLQLGFAKQEGRLGRISGTIVLDPRHAVENIDLEIETASVDTGWNLRDAFLRSEMMFDSARFPRITFHSTRFRYEGSRLAVVEGEVTLRGVTRAVGFDVTRLECVSRPGEERESCSAEVRGHLSRGAFGMDFAYPLIGDDVGLEFVVKAFRAREEGHVGKLPPGNP
jgi:polyisoprenoid-binding protein YceI